MPPTQDRRRKILCASSRWRAFLLCLAIFVVPGPAQAQTGLLDEQASLPAPGAAPRLVEDHLIVRFGKGADALERAAARDAAGADFLASLGNRIQLVEVQSDLDRAEARLEARDEVLYAERDFLYEPALTPNDSFFAANLWGMNNTGQTLGSTTGTPDADIDAPEAWDERTDSSSVPVAVVDSGITRNHSDLASMIWSNPGETAANGIDDDANGKVDDTWGWDFYSGDNEPVDEDRHGTHVAGTIGARGNDASGVTGVAWKSSLMSLRVCDDVCPHSAVIAAFNYAPSEGARVVNASLGGGSFSQAMADTIASHPDTLYVVAAGNGGTDRIGDSNDVIPYYPCSYPGINLICVGATNQSDEPATFSNFGTASVDISAPGVNVLSSAPQTATRLALENFETDNFLTNWSATGFSRTNEVAPPLSAFHATDSPGADYAANASATLESATFNTTDAVDCKLSYDASYGLGTGDLLFVEAQEGSGAWSEVARHTGTGSGSSRVRLGTGTTFENKATVRFRFRLAADAQVQGDGFHVDNVAVTCVSTTESNWLFLAGTSMATPHVAGSAALIFSKSSAATPRSVREALLSAGDVKSSLATANATGSRLNLKGALDAADVTPPDTSITAGPSGTTNSDSASFSFSSTEAGSSFECRLNAGAFAACPSPQELTGLSEGSHTFSVRAKDGAGNTDLSEATRTWAVDTAAPDTSIASGPSGTITSGSASFAFASTEPGAGSGFECKLDGPGAMTGAWVACSSPTDFSGLADGSYVFSVRATDAAGNTDAAEATRTFTVALPPPDAPPAPVPGPVPPAPATQAPSNVFSFIGKALVKHRLTILTVRVPGPGVLKAAQAGTGKALVRPVRVTAGAAGEPKLRIRPSSAGRKRLRKKRGFSVRLKVTYTPAGGTARSSVKRMKIKR